MFCVWYMFGVSKNAGLSYVYGFMEPQLIHTYNKMVGTQTYITTCFQQGKQIYLIPYIYMSKCSLLYCTYNPPF